MERFLTVVVLGGLTLGLLSVADAQSGQSATPESALTSEDLRGDLPPLPNAPKGKSTIIGGEIRALDPILDQFTLKVFGQKSVNILFDARTQIFRDGMKIKLADLRLGEHASVQTILDGTRVFAISIHMLSKTPEGEAQGHIQSYDSGTQVLVLRSAMSRDPIRLLVGANTTVSREGQLAFTSAQSGRSDLVNGALISAKFQSDKTGKAVANQIVILAVPGTAFVFSGELTYFDIPSGSLVVLDPRDDNSYSIVFDAARFPASQSLRRGQHVRVSASFDGSRYVASEITAN
jgi:hypothetical protein